MRSCAILSRAPGTKRSIAILFLFLSSTSLFSIEDGITTAHATNLNEEEGLVYGVDISWPMHHATVSTNYPWLPHNVEPEKSGTPNKYGNMAIQPLGDKQTHYDDLIKGCRKHYGKKARMCDATERDRIAMNLRQPESMQNYTEMGFKKIKAPDAVFKLIKEFWDNNKDNGSEEQWFDGNTYTNHWDTATKMVSVENVGLRGGGSRLKDKIWAAAKDVMQEWTGEELTPCSLYGIRTYHEGAVLAPHVDRMPLVSSAIINVAQDVDEDWPIEVYAHDGRAYNVSMKPGEMVLYESHSVIHGRPFPLKGRLYANIFVHFEPIGHSLRHEVKINAGDPNKKYREAVENGFGGHENTQSGLPPYIVSGSLEAKKWLDSHGNEEWEETEEATFETGTTEAHHAAKDGDLKALAIVARANPDHLDKEDSNGWRPLHEGARAGHLPIVKFLIESDVDINAKTNENLGGTALWYAAGIHGENHPVTAFLEASGALNIGPEL